MGQPNRTNSRRSGNGDARQNTSREDCRYGTRDPGHSSCGNGHPEHGSRCNRRVAARSGAQTASYVHDLPAKRPAVGAHAQGSAAEPTCSRAADAAGLAAPGLVAAVSQSCLADAVGVAGPVVLWLVAAVSQNCLADAVGVAGPAALWLVAAVLQNCLADAAAVAGPVVLWLVVAAVLQNCLADVAALWLAAAFRAWPAAPVSGVWPFHLAFLVERSPEHPFPPGEKARSYQ